MSASTRPNRPVLAGNGHASIGVLDLLLGEWDASDILVIAPPGGAHHAWQASLADTAAQHGVAVLEPPDVNHPEVIGRVADHGADLLLSVYYTKIFRAGLLGAVQGPAVNFHPSLLPRHRGVAPLIWAIAEGDVMTGMSVHALTLGVDTGPMLWQHPLPIHPDDTGFSLHMKAATLAVATAAELLRTMIAGRPLPSATDQVGPASHHSSRDPQLNQLDWRDPAERIRNIVRALAHPLPGAHTSWNGERIGIERVEALRSKAGVSKTPGMVEVDGDEVVVWAGDGPLLLASVRHADAIHPAGRLIDLGIQEGDFFS